MMLSAQNAGGFIFASFVTKEQGPFFCPMCKQGVVVKKGRVKIHHFAHIPPSTCAYGQGESEEHRYAKQEIYASLSQHPDVTKLQLERPLGNVRPDISFYLHTTPVAIEVQISSLSLETIDRRTRAYASKGISLLWASPLHSFPKDRYSPTFWEKYLHAMYFGKVYYWSRDETLQPVRFDDYLIEVPFTSWSESDGTESYENYGGGYSRRSKRYRMPCLLQPIPITSLSSVQRKPWRSDNMNIPAAKLWCEAYQKL